jgi:pyruvate/2-oxoglutarate dehydrogenase complex dihydrolipoamide dehydrogenase (E3) component
LDVWPLDEYNAVLLNKVHLLDNINSNPPYDEYNLVVIGAKAGGLISSKQAGLHGTKSTMISESLAGGDCLNIVCEPSTALIRSACAAREVRCAAEFGICISNPDQVTVDFGAITRRLRQF